MEASTSTQAITTVYLITIAQITLRVFTSCIQTATAYLTTSASTAFGRASGSVIQAIAAYRTTTAQITIMASTFMIQATTVYPTIIAP
jgi:hypothetical protein